VKQIRSLSSASLTSSRQAGEELADVGSDDFIRETELHLMTEEGRRLTLINMALENLEGGGFGACVDCGRAISLGRLRAKPYARLCIDCKVVREQNDGAAPDGVREAEPVEE
jgi:DnaK suppressor protein